MSMTDAFRKRFEFAGFREAARGFFRTPEAPASQILDERRLARIRDHEEDKQILTQVEREDSEMLNRVRAALYDTD